MYRKDQTDSRQTGNSTIMTTCAMGPAEVLDVDEWLYRAQRVRAFASTPAAYEPRHRSAS